MDRTSGILLAGGRSRRFGRDKLVEVVGGAPLFHRPLLALSSVCSTVVVVLAPDAAEPPLPADVAGIQLVRDEFAFAGPLSGCRTGLRSLSSGIAVLAGGDMPGLSAPILKLLAERAVASGREAVVLGDVDGYRPLPSALRVDAALPKASELLDVRGERRLRALFEALQPEVIARQIWERDDPQGRWREDIDEPGDLKKAGMP